MHSLIPLYVGLSWRMALVIAAWIICRVAWGGRIPARYLVIGWALIFVGLLVPARVPARLSPFNWFPQAVTIPTNSAFMGYEEEPTAPDATMATPSSPSPQAAKPVKIPLPAPAKIAAAQPVPAAHATAQTVSHDWRGLALAVWLGGTGLLLGARWYRWVQARRIVIGLAPTNSELLNNLVTACSQELGISRRIRVFEVMDWDNPAIIGLASPSLLFPVGIAEKFAEAELKLMVMHELGHWQRRDLWLQEFVYLARALHWFNPLVWVATRLCRDDTETACDQFVMQRMAVDDTPSYGATLLKAQALVSGRATCPVGLGIFGNKQNLKQRILMIARYRRPGAWRVLLGTATVAALLAICLTKELRAQDPVVITPPSSSRITAEAPPGWFRNGKNAENYTVGVDFSQPYRLPGSAYVTSNGPANGGDFGGMMQSFDSTQYLGKRLRLSAWMKTKEAAKGAQLWMRIDGDRQSGATPSLRFDNMDRRPHPMGTTDWQYCEVVLDVPAEAKAIFIGFFVKEAGQAWVNEAKLEEVGPDVPITDMKPKAPDRPMKPQNLEFNL